MLGCLQVHAAALLLKNFCAAVGSSTELYKDVKRATDSFLGVPSQCFQPAKAAIGVPPKRGDGRQQYCANVVRCHDSPVPDAQAHVMLCM